MADRQTGAPVDFVSLAAALLDRAETLVPQWLPAGRRQGHEWVCGGLDGGEGSSCSVNLRTGRWADFAADDKGGDLVALYAALHNLNQRQAAVELMRQLGWQTEPAAPAPTPPRPAAEAPAAAPAAGAARREKLWRAIVPVPAGVAPPARFHWGYRDKHTGQWHELEAVRVWEYVRDGERFGFVARFHRTNSRGEVEKETIPFTFCEDVNNPRGTREWRHKTWEHPRPLYLAAGLLSAEPERVPVVVVEGEKCAVAGHELLGHEFDFVSWPGGTNSWPAAAWGWLMGRTVILWPDADAKRVKLTAQEREQGVDPETKPLLPAAKQPGLKAMLGIGERLQAEYGCSVSMVGMRPPGELPDGWDIADAIEQGWDAERVRGYLRAAPAFVSPNEAARALVGDGTSTPTRAAAGGGGGGGAGGAGAQAADEDDAQRWRLHLMTSEKGAVRPVRENVVLALDGWPERGVPGIDECAGLIAFNQFSNTVTKLRPAPWGSPAGDWLETDELQLGDWLVRQHRMPSVSRQALEEAVLIVAHRHSYHPVRQRLLGLRGRWDGVDRLDTWLARTMLVEDEWDMRNVLHRYLACAGKWFLMAMVARVMPEVRQGARLLVGPGVKFDYMLILEGNQGAGKSTTCKILGGDFFADTGLDLSNKDSYMNIQGVWVYEWGELDSMSRQEVSKVKLFISSDHDRFRATFDKRPAKYPRQVVFIGTTNEAHYLTDTTGNRRFWPVRLTRDPDVQWLRDNLDQLLAEAVHRVDAGEKFWPDRAEQRELFDPQQSERMVESSLESAFRRYLYDEGQRVPMGEENGTLVDQIGLSTLLSRVGYTLDKQTDAVMKKAGAVMHMLGWEKKRSSKEGRPWVYVRPGRPVPQPTAPSGSQGSTSGPAPAHVAAEGLDDPPF